MLKKKTRIISSLLLTLILVATMASFALAGADGSPSIILRDRLVTGPDTLPSTPVIVITQTMAR